MYGIGRAEAVRFERHTGASSYTAGVLRAAQQKGARAVSVTRLNFPHFHPYGSGARPDLSFTLLRLHTRHYWPETPDLSWSLCRRVGRRMSRQGPGLIRDAHLQYVSRI
jgi:hypothetical protein